MGRKNIVWLMLLVEVLLVLSYGIKLNTYAAGQDGVGETLISDNSFSASEMLDISDEDVPLGTLAEHTGTTWWWLIIVVAVGVIGAEMLSRRQLKNAKRKDAFDDIPRLNN